MFRECIYTSILWNLWTTKLQNITTTNSVFGKGFWYWKLIPKKDSLKRLIRIHCNSNVMPSPSPPPPCFLWYQSWDAVGPVVIETVLFSGQERKIWGWYSGLRETEIERGKEERNYKTSQYTSVHTEGEHSDIKRPSRTEDLHITNDEWEHGHVAQNEAWEER